MTSVPLTVEHPMSSLQAGHSPNARFLAGDVPQGANEKARLGGAFGTSAIAHVTLALVGLFVATRLPDIAAPRNTPLDRPEVVWLSIPGPGGGGGGGNKMPDPPRKAESPGVEKVTVPAKKIPQITPAPPKDVPKPEPQLNIPVVAAASGIQEVPGALSGLPATPSTGSGTGTGAGSGTGSGLGPGSGGGMGGGIYRPGSGVSWPRLLFEKKPAYTADAMRAKVQGVVEVEALILPDGSVAEVRIVRSLDPTFGLDREAVAAVKQWRFAPALRQGQPVPVLVPIEVSFTLR